MSGLSGRSDAPGGLGPCPFDGSAYRRVPPAGVAWTVPEGGRQMTLGRGCGIPGAGRRFPVTDSVDRRSWQLPLIQEWQVWFLRGRSAVMFLILNMSEGTA